MDRGHRRRGITLCLSAMLMLAGRSADAQRGRPREGRRPAAQSPARSGGDAATSATPGAGSANGPSATVAAEAREHFDRGLTLLNSQNPEGAYAEFQRSYSLNPRPSVLYNLAVTLQALHRYPEAARSIEQYLRDVPNLSPARRSEVEQVLAQLRVLVAHVRIHAEPAGATVRIDGASAGVAPLADPVAVGPGRHAVEIIVDGHTAAREEFTIASGETRELQIGTAATATTATTTTTASGNPNGLVTANPSHTCSLTVRGTPPGATIEVDGHAVEPNRAIEGGAGEHTVVVSANGFATWRGSIGLAAGDHRSVNVRLVESASGLSPAPFAVALVGTVLLGGGAVVTGVLTTNTYARFQTLYQDDPEIANVAAEGDVLRNVTNALFVATGVVAATTIVLLTQTRFTSAASSADFAIAPLPGGAAASLRLRF